MSAAPQSLQEARLARARQSLEGLSIGDAFGEKFFLSFELIYKLIEAGLLPGPPFMVEDEFIVEQIIFLREVPGEKPWRYTDDTQMAMSIIEILRQHEAINQDALALSFGARHDRSRGYGAAMEDLLPRLWVGVPWQGAAQSLFQGQGSFGNGAAMRVAPVGAYFADDLDAVVENARRSAEITHAHPEAIAGAIAVAVAAAWAWRLRDEAVMPGREEFLNLILPSVPDSEVLNRIVEVRDLPGYEEITVQEVTEAVGNGEEITAQDTVPFVLWCASQHLNNYEEALWLTVSGLGDRDTTCAMVGGIVAMSAGAENIPADWASTREPLPTWPFADE
ncbi:MAG: ADP-ribosylglycohydrolase family protein [Abitibacteriaceae bacterium]|nr:ADP-ribosylglycohydrolase family protein [Abditibacteriaceae bacterium]